VDKEDSSYGITYESIALTRMAQGNLKDAEEPLRKSVSLLGENIDRVKTSDAYIESDFVANEVRMSQDWALNYLAVLCVRQGRSAEGLSLLNQAYTQAIAFHGSSQVVEAIIMNGQAAALLAGDEAAMSMWDKR